MGTFIIAEAGANHNRNMTTACHMIEVAKAAGCDAVKFQTYSADTMYCKNTPDFAGYKDVHTLIKSLELPREWQVELAQVCKDQCIEFMSTPFDERAVEELVDIGVKRLKIAGFESTDPRFVKLVASTKLPLVISCGIGRNAAKIVEWVLEENDNPDLTLLHCNNAYPTPIQDVNIEAMIHLGKFAVGKSMDEYFQWKWDKPIRFGLSDHTEGILIPPIAVTHGATVIEKHFTLNRQMPGPDHPFAVEPRELRPMVRNIREAEKCMGISRPEHLTESEKPFECGMRSVVAKRDIKESEVLTVDNLTTKRPLLGGNIAADSYYSILGREAFRDIGEDRALTIGDLR